MGADNGNKSITTPDPQAILEHADVGIIQLDWDLRLAYANARAADILEESRESLVGRMLQDVVPGEVFRGISHALKRCMKEKGSVTFETSCPRPAERWYGCRCTISEQGYTLVIQDILERKRAEKILRKSEEDYRYLFESSIDGILLTTPDGRISAANPAACRMLGRTEQEIIREGRNGILDTSDPKLEPLLNERNRTGRARGELTFRRRDGSTFPADTSTSIMTDSEGHVRSSVLFRDITELKSSQDSLRKMNEMLERKVEERTGSLEKAGRLMKDQKELLQTIIDSIPVIITLWSPSGKLKLVNRAFEQVTGWSAQDAAHMDILAAAFPDPAYRKSVIRKVARAKAAWDEFEMLTRSGRILIISWAAVGLSDGTRVGIGIDITGRRKMEKDIIRLAAAIEQTGDGIDITNLDGVIEYVNPALEKITGYSREELVGESVSSLPGFLAGSDECVLYDRVRKDGRPWSGRQARKKKSGEVIDVNVTISPVRDESGQIISTVSITRDITREIRLQEQLSQNQKLEAMGTLAGGIAHDLKNMLTPIVINSEIALMDLEDDHPARVLLEEIMQAARMGTDLVSQIVTFSRRSMQEKKPVAIGPVVREAVDFLRSALPSTIEIRQQLPGGDAVVMADSTRIKQVMINLGSNAGYAMREKGGELDIILTRDDVSEQEAERISPDLKAGTYVRIMVRDTGEGMDGPTMQRIFEPFFTTKKQGEGSGMGLSVVHGIVKEHQGAISVWSRPGRGSTFSVWLPVVKEGDRGRRTGAKSGRVETRSSRYGL
jgi:PAS domain S-box-containing protein